MDTFDDALSGLKFVGGLPRAGVVGGGAMIGQRGGLSVPSDVRGLVTWLDASDVSTITEAMNVVQTIADKSGQGNDATQGNPTLRPILTPAAQNGLSGLLFDSVDDLMDIPNSPELEAIADEISIFFVAKFNPLANFATGHIRKWSGTGNGVYIQNDSNGDALWRIATSAGSQVIPDVDALRPPVFTNIATQGGVILNSGNYDLRGASGSIESGTYDHGGGFSSNTGIRLFDRANGFLFELLVYNRAVSVAEAVFIEGYLAAKWGL